VATGPPAAAVGPSRDELTLAWADQILPELPRAARAVLAAGHWVDTPQGVALAVPNEPHRVRSEQHRADLESALPRHFGGRTLPVRFVVDDGVPALPARPSERPAADRPPPVGPDVDEAIDPAELVDAAPDDYVAPLDRLTQAFPGAELLDES
jgi:hypothetical protein